jgi:hypothetical protein
VFDADTRPVLGLVVHLTGGGLDVSSVTGGAPDLGPGGYEIVLGDAPIDSDGVYHLRLLAATGEPLSAVYPLRTYADCTKNLIVVNFAALE